MLLYFLQVVQEQLEILRAVAKSSLCLSEGARSSRPKSLLAVVGTLRFAQGDTFSFCQATLRDTVGKLWAWGTNQWVKD